LTQLEDLLEAVLSIAQQVCLIHTIPPQRLIRVRRERPIVIVNVVAAQDDQSFDWTLRISALKRRYYWLSGSTQVCTKRAQIPSLVY
jgi:hypothetical protein